MQESQEKPKRTRKPKSKTDSAKQAAEKEESIIADNLTNDGAAEEKAAEPEETTPEPEKKATEPEEKEAVTEEITEKTEEAIVESEENTAEDEKTEISMEENQFILPEEATFFVTEPQDSESELFPLESENGGAEGTLLNIEHFSDYKRKSDEIDEVPEEAEEDEPADQSVIYESITILDDEDSEDSLPTQSKQKYEDPDRERYDPKKPRKVDGRFDFLELFVFTLLAVMLITTFIFRHSVVEGSSMEETLYEGDHLIISDLFYTPKKGDIIVCQDRATGHENPVVKRIIATEGDTIEILPDGSVFVNDKILTEDYVYTDAPDMFKGLPKTTVPEDTVFVMGDHRNKSSDSRYFDSIFVREDAILGKVILRFYPFDKFGKVN